MNLEDIARIAHETNRVYCQVMGDDSHLPTWENAPDWQKASAITGVKTYLDNPTITPEMGHENWMKLKQETGWVYGKVKDPDKKEHPCMVPYSELPPEQKLKDSLFGAVVKAIIPF